MPRLARLDRPGLLQHVIVRGIEGCSIFLDDKDRASFLERFSKLLKEMGTECFAWSLLDNHVHLLLRPGHRPLAHFMRRLLTAHAVIFNLRHKRIGHLFQNRYKSIVCEEEAYLLELVRYIHLNPLRAGIVTDMEQLDGYQWCGHAIVMGRRSLPEQNTDYILIRFGKKVGAARQNYRTFVQSGITQGKRDDLVGGGLKRSYQSLPGKELVASDQRILGSGAFVEACRHEDKSDVMPMETIVDNLAAALDVIPYELKQRTKKKEISEVRNIISYVVVRCRGYNGAELARYLNVTRSAVSTGADRGRSLIEGNKNLEAAVSNFTK